MLLRVAGWLYDNRTDMSTDHRYFDGFAVGYGIPCWIERTVTM